MLNSPQQEHGSLDCGVAVCYVIRQFYRQQPIDTKPAETEIRVMRTEIVETLVRWGVEEKYFNGRQKAIVIRSEGAETVSPCDVGYV